MGDNSYVEWDPRCEVVVHESRAAYQRAVGAGSERTYGSSLIRFTQDRVAVRRIDVLPNAEGQLAALPHELVHVVLADRFSGRQPPRWVDEGSRLWRIVGKNDDCIIATANLRCAPEPPCRSMHCCG